MPKFPPLFLSLFLSFLILGKSLSFPAYPRVAAPSIGLSYDPAPSPKYSPSPAPVHHKGMPYNYNWAVADPEQGLDFGHSTDSDGAVVKGEYRVLLPDGRTQIVRYTADHDSGYVAEVTYEGEARPYVPPKKPAHPQAS